MTLPKNYLPGCLWYTCTDSSTPKLRAGLCIQYITLTDLPPSHSGHRLPNRAVTSPCLPQYTHIPVRLEWAPLTLINELSTSNQIKQALLGFWRWFGTPTRTWSNGYRCIGRKALAGPFGKTAQSYLITIWNMWECSDGYTVITYNTKVKLYSKLIVLLKGSNC